jgi:threonine dehydrogenase-like Zn-dependent dehydrogenase
MNVKRYLWVGILLAAALATTGCIGDSTEVDAAKAEYIRARAYQIKTEAKRTEEEIALLQQQRGLAQVNAELAAELKRQRHQAFIKTSQVVIVGGGCVGSLLALLHILRLLIYAWAEQRASLLKHERRLQEARARAVLEQRETLKLQVQWARAQARSAREQRWLEHTRRTQEVPLEHETADGNGHWH